MVITVPLLIVIVVMLEPPIGMELPDIIDEPMEDEAIELIEFMEDMEFMPDDIALPIEFVVAAAAMLEVVAAIAEDAIEDVITTPPAAFVMIRGWTENHVAATSLMTIPPNTAE